MLRRKRHERATGSTPATMVPAARARAAAEPVTAEPAAAEPAAAEPAAAEPATAEPAAAAAWSLRRIVAAAVFTAVAAAAFAVVPAESAAAAAAFDVPASDFVSASTVTVTGTKDFGSTLVIRRDDQLVCTVDDPSALTWQCSGVATSNGVHEFSGDETLADGSVVPLAPLTLRVLSSPALDGAGGAIETTGRFTGVAQPGASIQLSSTGPDGTRTHLCPAAIDNGFWSCVVAGVDLPSGEYQVRARQSSPAIGPEFSEFSAAVNAIVDRAAPNAPLVTSPQPGLTTVPEAMVRGGGEQGALVQVFIDGQLECEAVVSASGSWQCAVRWPGVGTHIVQALQRDRAGNFSPVSERIEVRFAPPRPPAVVDPPVSAPDPRPQPETAPSPAESPATPTPSPTAPGTPAPNSPDAPGTPPGTPPDPVTSNWGTPTGFGGSLPTAAQVFERGGWMLAPLAGIAYLLLIALPMRWFSTRVRPRLTAYRPQLTGRNRREPVSVSGPHSRLSPALVAVATLGGAAVIAALSAGIDAEVRYLRLTAAIGFALVLLNAGGVLLPSRVAGRVTRVSVGVRLLPGILLVALALALFSRFAGLQPPLLVGVLIAAAAVFGSGRRVRAWVAVAQISAVAALAFVGWAAHDLLTPSTGFWMTLWSETAAALALGGLGSLLILLLPLGSLPGRTLYAVSRPAWAAVAFVSASLVGAILASGPAFPLAALLLLAAGFAGVLVAITVWVRWVAPAWR